ncbi:RNA 2',3'-cyclic phosphodiesterase [Thalassotalea fonticola]|uniref:RNA 2',3'-cyclic phosphodiesterase n=1 Tax=Thalassotalea fonticola TaxID=3065649 RepID=A0ABZ0GKC5_9GAMM|nr:RNA 2',3'-cyclic phosphodiesterase [Colwelliaceae bacterium S1-1]
MGRYFFGLDLPINNKQKIAAWRDVHLPSDNKSVVLENFHITLVFLGMVDDLTLQQCIAAADNIVGSTFSLVLNDVGFWAKPKVLFLSSNKVDIALQTLVADLENLALSNSIKLERRPYIPHLTLCRKATAHAVMSAQPEFEFTFTDFCLYESKSTEQGVRYVVIHRWRLR